MENTVPAQEIKRRGMAAVDELLEQGPVHVIRNNRPEYVILSEQAYQRLLGTGEETGQLWGWLERTCRSPGSGKSAGTLLEGLRSERDSWEDEA